MWGQLQRCYVLQDEVTATIVVNALYGSEDAVGIVDNGSTSDLCIRDESIVAKIIGPDEDAVNSLVWWVVHEFCTILVDIFRVCDVRRNLVLLHSWEGCVNGGKGTRGDVVAANGARYGVVVDIRAGVLCDVLWPGSPSAGGLVVLQDYLAFEDPG